MAYRDINIETTIDRPLVTVRRSSTIGFNAAFVKAAFPHGQIAKRFLFRADDDMRKIAIVACDSGGVALCPDGAKSSGLMVTSRALFKSIPWLVEGRYEPTYDVGEQAWVITILR